MPRQKKAKGGTAAKPDDNEARILHVAERLFARRGYRNVTVRDIADAAHVTHPLIYHYFGSKRGLFAAVLKKNQGKMRAVAEASRGAEDTVRNIAQASLTHSRTYQMILARAFADGMSPADWPGGFPGIEAALARLLEELPAGHGGGETEIRERLAAAVAMIHGWVVNERQLLALAGLEPEDRDAMRARIVREVGELIRPVLPPGD